MEKDSNFKTSPSSFYSGDSASDQEKSFAFQLQNVTVVCLNSSTDQSNVDQTNWVAEVQRNVDFAHVFTDADGCLDFLTKTTKNKVFVIISATVNEHIVSLVEQFARVDSIYIISIDKTIDETWISKFKKVKRIFVHTKEISDLLKGGIQLCEKSSVSTIVISDNDSTNNSSHENNQPFSHIPSNISIEHDADYKIMNEIISHTPSAGPLENIVVICLDTNNDLYGNAERNWFIEVQCRANIVHTFVDVDECVDFLTEIENETILMIVSGDSSLYNVPYFEEFHQLKFLYILSTDKTLDGIWASKYGKVKGVFALVEDILPSFTYDIEQCERGLVPISIIQANNSAPTALNEVDQSFMYTQLLKEILFKINFNNTAKQNFTDFCRRQYSDYNSTIQLIDQFDRDYHIHSPIWWYSKETFIYSILNRAFRTQEINTILIMGFFVQDLHRQIKHLYETWSDKPDLMVVYRGQGMLNIEFEKLQKGKGGLLSFNSFLSTSTDRDVSFVFADSVRADPSLVGVLFELKINPKLCLTPFASLDNDSHYQDEKEILFSMHSIFEIGEVYQIDERLWRVELLSTTNTDQKMSVLCDCMRKTIIDNEEDSWGQLGHLLLKMGEYNEAERIFKAIVDRYSVFNPNRMTCLNAFYGLGSIKWLQSDYTHALLFFHKALQLNIPHCITFAPIYIGIALVHTSMGNYSAALLTHKKTLEILQKYAGDNDEKLAVTYGHIGDTYITLGRPLDALLYLKKSLEIQQNLLPSNHPDLAVSYNWMGEAYRLAGYYSHAFSYYEKAFIIQQKYLPRDHISLAHTLNDMGLVYEKLADYSSALSCLQKALQIRQNLLVPVHPEIAKTYNNIGQVLHSMKYYLKSLSAYQKALDIYETLVDLDLPGLAKTYNNIATVFVDMSEYSTALGFYQKTLQIEQKCFSHDHSTLATTYNNIAAAYQNMQNYPTALSFFKKSLDIQGKYLHLNHPDRATIYNNLAVTYIDMGDNPTALSFLEDSRDIQEKYLPPNHPGLATIYNNLAVTYLKTGDSWTALSFFEKSRLILEKCSGYNDPKLASTYHGLSIVYQRIGHHSTAFSFHDKSRRIQENELH